MTSLAILPLSGYRALQLCLELLVDFAQACAACLVAQSCPTLCDPMYCSSPGSSVLGGSPGKNTGVGCHALLQGIFLTQGLNPGLTCGRRILYCLSHQGICISMSCLKSIFEFQRLETIFYTTKQPLLLLPQMLKQVFGSQIKGHSFHIQQNPEVKEGSKIFRSRSSNLSS